jgi:CBS domain-containing protein
MKVADIMTKDLLTVAPVETIEQAEDLMNTNKIRQLPVAHRYRYRSEHPLFSQWLAF